MKPTHKPAPLIELVDIGKTYVNGELAVEVLHGVSLKIYPGEFVAIMGASGSGKSTLMNLLGCLDRPTVGTYLFAGEDISHLDEDGLARLRRDVFGFIFQSYNLISTASATENVVMPALIAGTKRRPAEARARDLLDLLGLGDRAGQMPAMLSGGQRQRLAIARALANEPTVVLADEPTGALDSEGGAEVLELFRRLHQGGQTILLVTHDQPIADAAERIVRMRDGRVLDDGTDPAQDDVATGTTDEPAGVGIEG